MKKMLEIFIMAVFLLVGTHSLAGFIPSFGGADYIDFSQRIPVLAEDTYDMVIITPEIFSNEIQTLIEHKNSVGIRTFCKTTEEIYDESEGVDEPEKIKYFIKNAVETWGIDYALLVGDISKLPIRTTYPQKLWGVSIPDVLTDLYYADLFFDNGTFCCWDSNNNGYYGEYNHTGNYDNLDLYPDIYVGRLACHTKYGVKNVVKKIIHYEKETWDNDWFNNLILCGGDTDSGGAVEGEILSDWIIGNLPGFNPIKCLASQGTFNPKSINQAITNGAGFLYFSGHGFEWGMGTHPPGKDDWLTYFTPNLLGAKNRFKLPVAYFDACSTAGLDFNYSRLVQYLLWWYIYGGEYMIESSLNTLPIEGTENFLFPCFAWCCVAKPGGGTIASIGSTRTAYGFANSPSDLYGSVFLSTHFFKSYEKGKSLGEMFVQSQKEYLNKIRTDHVTVEEYILLGDPSLKIGGYTQIYGGEQ